jgi:hypothetical protein
MRKRATNPLSIGVFIGIAIALSACGLLRPRPPAPPVEPTVAVTPFSAAAPGGPFPKGWYAAALPSLRKLTVYELVDDAGTTVVRAHAESSSSGMVHDVNIDVRAFPVVRWRWKVMQLIPGADNTRREGEDAPVRLEFSFDGDKPQLPFNERLFFAQVKAIAGLDVPYATLEYIWGSGAPAGAELINSWTSRIRTLLVQSGPDNLGKWVSEERNLYEDFKRIFGEEPGLLLHVGIYTDADATRATAEGYYGDIEFVRAPAETQEGLSSNN